MTTTKKHSIVIGIVVLSCEYASSGIAAEGQNSDAKIFKSSVTASKSPPKEDILHNDNFPYKSCLQILIKKISTHHGYLYHGDKAKLDVVGVIEEVLKAGTPYSDPTEDTGFHKGAVITLVIDKPELLSVFKTDQALLIGTRVVWAINWWRIGEGVYHLDSLFEPFSNHKFTHQDVERLKHKLERAK